MGMTERDRAATPKDFDIAIDWRTLKEVEKIKSCLPM
jgi:hypothetical protein